MQRCEIPVAGRPSPAVVELVEGDITQQEVDAIVNAANRTLLGGGGVDGAIHRAGGPAILEACRRLGGCETGEAKITTGGRLPAKVVIHTVGPVFRDGSHGEPELLASAYRQSLELADQRSLQSIAFPSISTGAYRYPIEEAAKVALSTTIGTLGRCRHVARVRFVLFSRPDLTVYERVLATLSTSLGEH